MSDGGVVSEDGMVSNGDKNEMLVVGVISDGD